MTVTLGELRSPPTLPLPEAAPQTHEASRPREGPSPFATALRALGREAERGETLTRTAVRAGERGQDLGPGELIALQAGIYRYSEVIDLATKLVDRAGTDVKTVLQGQQ